MRVSTPLARGPVGAVGPRAPDYQAHLTATALSALGAISTHTYTGPTIAAGMLATGQRVDAPVAIVLNRGGAVAVDMGIVGGDVLAFMDARRISGPSATGGSGQFLSNSVGLSDLGGHQIQARVYTIVGVTGTANLALAPGNLDGLTLVGLDYIGDPFAVTFSAPATVQDILDQMFNQGPASFSCTVSGTLRLAFPATSVDYAGSTAATVLGFAVGNSTGVAPDFTHITAGDVTVGAILLPITAIPMT